MGIDDVILNRTMRDELEDEHGPYCAECGFILPTACAYGKPYVTCVPCGEHVCDRRCLADHKRVCHAAKESRERLPQRREAAERRRRAREDLWHDPDGPRFMLTDIRGQ